MPAKLSVVVPFYGVEHYIRECLTSIAAQTLHDLEVILVDDQSPDGSRAIADEFAALDPRFRVVARPNGGLGPARNTGVEHASGEYLAFIDSDDIVAPFAFQHMVDALDLTGSAFAAGNARRFNNTLGSRPSWTHKVPFAHTRMGTHIMEVPTLARDRMVWNKVYRRSFWDEHAYAFPAIRYEDYPVTFPAHTAASSVDVLEETVYFWRERESGDSITQNAYQFDNLRDRVTSAMLVLDDAESTTPQVREVLHHALAEADFLTLAQAFGQVPDQDFERLRSLTLSLVDRIGVATVRNRHPYDYLQYRAIRRGDLELAAELATFRAGGGLGGTLRASRRPRLGAGWRFPYPGDGRPGMPRWPYRAGRSLVRLHTSVTHIDAAEHGITFTGTADIRNVPTTQDSSLTARVGVDDRWVPLALSRHTDIDSHGTDGLVGFRFTLTAPMLRNFAGTQSSVGIELTMRQGTLTRTGLLNGGQEGSPRWCQRMELSADQQALVTLTPAGHYSIVLEPFTHRLVQAQVRGQALELSVLGHELPQGATFLLTGSPGQPDFTARARGQREADGRWRYRLRIPLRELSRGRADFDPFVEQRDRALSVVLPIPESQFEQWQAASALDPGPIVIGPEGQTARARRCIDEVGAVVTVHELLWSLGWGMPTQSLRFTIEAGQILTLSRSRGYLAVLTTGAPRATIDQIKTASDTDALVLDLSGPSQVLPPGQTVAWTQFHPASNDPVFAPGSFQIAGDRWHLRTPLAALLHSQVAQTEEAVAGQPLADWSLLCLDGDEVRTAALIDPFANTALPLTHDEDDRRLSVIPVNDILHATVRRHHGVEDRFGGAH